LIFFNENIKNTYTLLNTYYKDIDLTFKNDTINKGKNLGLIKTIISVVEPGIEPFTGEEIEDKIINIKAENTQLSLDLKKKMEDIDLQWEKMNEFKKTYLETLEKIKDEGFDDVFFK